MLGQVVPPAVDIVAPVVDTTTVLPSDDPTGSSPSDESLPVLDQVVTPLVTDVTDLGTGLIDPLSAPSEGPPNGPLGLVTQPLDSVTQLVAPIMTPPAPPSNGAGGDGLLAPVTNLLTTPPSDDGLLAPVTNLLTTPPSDDGLLAPVTNLLTTPPSDDGLLAPVTNLLTTPPGDGLLAPVTNLLTTPPSDGLLAPVTNLLTPPSDGLLTPVTNLLTGPPSSNGLLAPSTNLLTQPPSSNGLTRAGPWRPAAHRSARPGPARLPDHARVAPDRSRAAGRPACRTARRPRLLGPPGRPLDGLARGPRPGGARIDDLPAVPTRRRSHDPREPAGAADA